MNSLAIVETPAGINRLFYLTTLISNVLYKNSAVDHQTLATYIHRFVDAYHPSKLPAPCELPLEVTVGRNLIGFAAEQEKRLQVAKAQAALGQLGYKVGMIDGKYGSKTKAAVKAFQKNQKLKVDGKIDDNLLRELKIAVKNLPAAESSQTMPAEGQ